jgi:hypothetical protein
MINVENWSRYIPNESMPVEHQRVLVSDGETVVIARYVLTDSHINWLFDEESHKDIKIEWFQSLPPEPPVIVSGSVEKS